MVGGARRRRATSRSRGPGTQLEHRVADGAAAVHLTAAVCLASARRRVQNEIECPPAQTQDCITGVDTDVSVPPGLGAALEALAEDEEFVKAFSPAYVEGFLAVRRAEWQRFVTTTTDWELNEYLEYD